MTYSEMNHKLNQEKSTLPGSKKIPRWLEGPPNIKIDTSEIDCLEGDGTAKDTARHRPPHKWKTHKKVKKKIKEVEELYDFGEKKVTDRFLEGFVDTLNSMIE